MLSHTKRITTPTTAFITFEEEIGIALALKEENMFTREDGLSIMPIKSQGKFKAASEPTDIIWENRHFTNYERKIREAKAYGTVILVLLVSFYAIF